MAGADERHGRETARILDALGADDDLVVAGLLHDRAKPAGTLQIQTWTFTLSTFTVGKYMIPPQQVAFIPEAASAARAAALNFIE